MKGHTAIYEVMAIPAVTFHPATLNAPPAIHGPFYKTTPLIDCKPLPASFEIGYLRAFL
jgi:hypothetical protein